MEAWIQGQKAEATLVRPVTVNLTMQHIVERPRRLGAAAPISETEDLAMYATKFGACHRLEPRGLYPGRIGFCRWLHQWIQGHECATCIHSGES